MRPSIRDGVRPPRCEVGGRSLSLDALGRGAGLWPWACPGGRPCPCVVSGELDTWPPGPGPSPRPDFPAVRGQGSGVRGVCLALQQAVPMTAAGDSHSACTAVRTLVRPPPRAPQLSFLPSLSRRAPPWTHFCLSVLQSACWPEAWARGSVVAWTEAAQVLGLGLPGRGGGCALSDAGRGGCLSPAEPS